MKGKVYVHDTKEPITSRNIQNFMLSYSVGLKVKKKLLQNR